MSTAYIYGLRPHLVYARRAVGRIFTALVVKGLIVALLSVQHGDILRFTEKCVYPPISGPVLIN